jgi:Na+/H+-translocating membrane pyrophosphatase
MLCCSSACAAVGDPFKDTSGPALHVIITTLSTSVLVLGPFLATAAGVKA